MNKILVRVDAPIIEPADPWAGDDLNRKVHGDRLLRLIENTPGTTVLWLSAPWGSGKSVFLRRWVASLALVKVPVIVVDSWSFDYLDDPLGALLISLTRALKQSGVGSKKQAAKKLASGIADVGAKLIAPVVRVAAAMGTTGASELLLTAADLVRETGESLIQKAEEHDSAINELRMLLKKARKTLGAPGEGASASPLIFVIDELDRCRPDFAMKMLERVKHLFSLEGIVFVIAADATNLPNAVNGVYGSRIDGERYLRKFFDYEFRLPDPSPEQAAISMLTASGILREPLLKNSESSLDALRKRWRDGYQTETDVGARGPFFAAALIESLLTMIRHMELSLRDCSQIVTIVVAAIRSVPNQVHVFPAALVFGACLRFCAPEQFQALQGRSALSKILADSNLKIFERSNSNVRISPPEILSDDDPVFGVLNLIKAIGAMPGAERIDWVGNFMERTGDNVTYSRRRGLIARIDGHALRQTNSSIDDYMRMLYNVAGAYSPV